jgi:ABC-2 type transport system permease protein
MLATNQIKQRYVRTKLGYLWGVLDPLLLFGALYFVMDRVVQFGAEIEHYAAFLYMNLLLFYFFREGATRGMRSIRANERLVRKMEMPRVVLPFSAVMASTISFLVNVPVLYAFMLLTGVQPMWTWLLLPVIMLPLFVLTCGTALLLAGIYARSADAEHVWRIIARVLMFSTPVLYAIESLPDRRTQDIVYSNPIAPILEQARIWMIEPNAPGVASVVGEQALLISLGVFVVICGLGVVLYRFEAPRLAEEL